MDEIRTLAIRLVAVVALFFALYLIVVFLPLAAPRMGSTFEPSSSSAIPVPTPESAAIARAPQSFQHLVSFTKRGFEPSSVFIEAGETVRFVNNTKHDLVLAGPNLVSSVAVVSRDYVEIIFNETGEYPYSDKETKRAGVVRAE